MEAFSDGVLAIIITIMVIELQPSHATEFHALRPLIPVVLSYVLSFLYLVSRHLLEQPPPHAPRDW
jgi:uncharacterized membrane protein